MLYHLKSNAQLIRAGERMKTNLWRLTERLVEDLNFKLISLEKSENFMKFRDEMR